MIQLVNTENLVVIVLTTFDWQKTIYDYINWLYVLFKSCKDTPWNFYVSDKFF